MQEFTRLTIVDLKRVTANAVTLTLAVPPHARRAFAFKPGQFLNVRASIDGNDVQRSYSICSDPADDRLTIAIKRISNGHFSEWANSQLRIGMKFEAAAPQGRFVLRNSDGSPRQVLALAAGAGITPLISIVRHGLHHEPHSHFTLIYGNRSIEDIIFREELEALKDRFIERFTLLHVLSGSHQAETTVLEGRIDAAKVARLAPRLFEPREIAHAFVCGPGGMIRDVRNALVNLGMSQQKIHHEIFSPGGGAFRTTSPAIETPTAASSISAEVSVIVDGARRTFTAQPNETVVDAALRVGVRVPYSCKGGMCCTCRARLVEGTAEMRLNYSLEPWEQERGFLLTCQAIPTSPRLVVDYDQL